jgi:hypothetical protein
MRTQTAGSIQQMHLFAMIHGVPDLCQYLGHGHGSELENSLRKVGTDVPRSKIGLSSQFLLVKRQLGRHSISHFLLSTIMVVTGGSHLPERPSVHHLTHANG